MTAKDRSPSLGDQAGEPLTDLLVERERQIRMLHRAYRNISTWGIGVGKLRIRASVGSNFIAIIFIVWHLLLGAGGVVAILIWDGVRELGVALLVGALFSFGSFLAQFWSQAMDKEREFVHKVWLEDDVQLFRETLSSLTDLDQRIDQLVMTSRRGSPA